MFWNIGLDESSLLSVSTNAVFLYHGMRKADFLCEFYLSFFPNDVLAGENRYIFLCGMLGICPIAPNEPMCPTCGGVAPEGVTMAGYYA